MKKGVPTTASVGRGQEGIQEEVADLPPGEFRTLGRKVQVKGILGSMNRRRDGEP